MGNPQTVNIDITKPETIIPHLLQRGLQAQQATRVLKENLARANNPELEEVRVLVDVLHAMTQSQTLMMAALAAVLKRDVNPLIKVPTLRI